MALAEQVFIFLDFDGVMVSRRSLIAFGDYKASSVDPVALMLVNTLCEMLDRAGYEPLIVISSDWRIAHPETLFWHKLFANCPSVVMGGVTPHDGPAADRGSECKQYLNHRGRPDAKWVAFDDQPLGSLDHKRVQVDPSIGITHEDIDTAFHKLTNTKLLPEEFDFLGKWQQLKAWAKRRENVLVLRG